MVHTTTEILDPNPVDLLDDPTLVDPDACDSSDPDAPFPLNMGPDLERQLVSHVLHGAEFVAVAADTLSPQSLTNRAHQTAARIAYEYYRDHGTLIPRPVMEGLFKLKLDGDKSKPAFLAELKLLYDNFYIDGTKDFFLKKLKEYARRYTVAKAHHKLLEKGDWKAYYAEVEKSKTFAPATGATEAAWYTDDDVDAFTAPVWQVAEHVERGSLVCVFGSSGSGKTFYCLDLAFCVATGRRFLDRFDVQKGKVCYVCSEGGQSGYKIRRDAWKTHHGVKAIPRESYVFTLSAFDLSDGAEVEKLAEKAKAHFGGFPDLIVIDTLSMNFGGGDVDKNQDMKRFTLEMDRLRRITGATVLVVHHTGWSEKERETGAKTLRNSIDTSVIVSREGNEVKVGFKKQRNAALGESYVLLSKPVGTSAVLVYEAAPATTTTDDDAEKQVAAVIPVGTKANDGVTVDQIVSDTGLERSTVQKSAAELFKRKAVQRAREGGVTMPFRYWREELLA